MREQNCASYNEQLNYSFCEAHDVHGHGHSVGKGENKTNGAAKLWAQTSRY